MKYENCERGGCKSKAQIQLCIKHLELAEKEARDEERERFEKELHLIAQCLYHQHIFCPAISKKDFSCKNKLCPLHPRYKTPKEESK